MEPDKELLISLVKDKMPFGKYQGKLLYEIPMFYLEWLQRKGFPKGKLGQQLSTVYEIKLNGLESIFLELKKLN